MVRKVSGWTAIILRVCLEGMGGFDDEETRVGWKCEFFFSSFFEIDIYLFLVSPR